MHHPSQSQLLTCYFLQQDWPWLTDDLQRGSTSMMEPLLARIVHAQSTASAANSIGAHVRAPLPPLRTALEFHTRAMPCLRADDGYSLLSSDVKHLL